MLHKRSNFRNIIETTSNQEQLKELERASLKQIKF